MTCRRLKRALAIAGFLTWLLPTNSGATEAVGETAGKDARILLGLYGVPAEECSLVASLGFTVVHTFTLQAGSYQTSSEYVAAARTYLDQAHRHGLRVLTGLPRHWLREKRETATRDAIRALRDHPALLAWYEEENAQQGHKSAALFAHAIVQEEDPQRGLVLSEAVRDRDLADVGRARVFTYYAVTPRARRSRQLQKLEERFPVGELGVPFWPVLQCYADELVEGYDKPRFLVPRREELRYTLHSALIAGAEAILFYPFLHATRFDRERHERGQWGFTDYKTLPEIAPELWHAVCATTEEARVLLSLLRGARRLDARRMLRVPRSVEVGTWETRDGLLVLFANRRRTPESFEVRVPPRTTSYQQLFHGGFSKERRIEDDVVRVELSGPGGTALLLD